MRSTRYRMGPTSSLLRARTPVATGSPGNLNQPSKQERVVYAETLTFPPPLENAPATDAMMLLARVMLDKTLSATIFADPLALQSDVLGEAAEEIIRRWPPP